MWKLKGSLFGTSCQSIGLSEPLSKGPQLMLNMEAGCSPLLMLESFQWCFEGPQPFMSGLSISRQRTYGPVPLRILVPSSATWR